MSKKVLSKERLENIRDRAEQATPGPWRLGPESNRVVTTIKTDKGLKTFELGMFCAYSLDESKYLPAADDILNTMFTVCARQDIPDLLDYIEFLEQYNNRLRMQALNEGRRENPYD